MDEQPFSHHRTDTLIMTKDLDQKAERILDLTMEIICLLTGENYTIVKKSGESATYRSSLSVPEGHCRTQCPILDPPLVSLRHKRNNDQKILELANEIIHLLNGEVPIRCEDVAVYLSLEEWEYLGRNKELYKEVKMEDHQPLSSLGRTRQREEGVRKNSTDGCLLRSNQSASEDEPLDASVSRKTPERFQKRNVSPCFINEDGTVVENYYEAKFFREDKSESQSECTKKEPDNPALCKGENLPGAGLSALTKHVQTETSTEARGYANEVSTVLETNQYSESSLNNSTSKAAEINICSESDSNLVSHQTVHKQNTLSCSECGEHFSCESELAIHKRIHTGENAFPCTAAFVLQEKPTGEERPLGHPHVTNASNVKNQTVPSVKKDFLCSECGKGFSKKSHLVIHQRIHTGDKPVVCLDCGKCFRENSDLVKHQRVHTGEKPFVCTDCGKCFSWKADLVVHKRIHTGEKPFVCSECGKCFIQSSHLLKHQKTHTGEKPFACTDCGKCFSWNADLVVHKRIHTGEKPFVCSECGKCFIQSSHLLKHQITHTGEKPFACSDCGKCFSRKADLVVHKRIHTGEKPFACPECGKCFRHSSAFSQHQIIHTGIKPFVCSECGKCFSHNTNLVAHQKTHSGEKPFACSECGKRFHIKTSLVQHERSHAGGKPFECTDCGKCFSHNVSLSRHRRVHTEVKTPLFQ